jgi:hypothetical protein
MVKALSVGEFTQQSPSLEKIASRKRETGGIAN